MNSKYQHNYSTKQMSMYEENIRINKANKTIAVLKDYLEDIENLDLLDIGSSTGFMTNEYAKHFNKVIGIDLDSSAVEYAKNNFKKDNLQFLDTPIEESSFNENSFDIITCSHIYEHVPSDRALMDNIYKLLKPGGICYFAAVNRFQIIEPHYELPFLSYFPKKIANKYIRLFRNEEEYYENLKSHRNLRKLVSRFDIIDYTLKILKEPSKFSANELLKKNTFKYYIINLLSKIFYFIIPTYIWLLIKPDK